MAPSRAAQGGFTLVEVLVALIILTVGVLGLAGTTALAVRQVTFADVSAERAAALQSALEQLRRLPYDSVAAGHDSIGQFRVQWAVTAEQRSKRILVVTLGPGLSGGGGMPGLSRNVADTFEYRILDSW